MSGKKTKSGQYVGAQILARHQSLYASTCFLSTVREEKMQGLNVNIQTTFSTDVLWKNPLTFRSQPYLFYFSAEPKSESQWVTVSVQTWGGSFYPFSFLSHSLPLINPKNNVSKSVPRTLDVSMRMSCDPRCQSTLTHF